MAIKVTFTTPQGDGSPATQIFDEGRTWAYNDGRLRILVGRGQSALAEFAEQQVLSVEKV